MARGTFSGSNYLTHTGFTTSSGQKFALGCWFKMAATTTTYVLLGVRQGDSGAGNWTSIRNEDTGGATKIQFICDYFGTSIAFYNTTTIDDNAWHHVFCYYNGTRAKIFFDGSEEADNGTDKTNVIISTTNTWAIGRRSDYNAEAFVGYIAEAAFWKGQTFTDSEIAAMGAGYSPRFFLAGMEMYYSLLPNDENDLINARNLSDQGTTGTLDHPRIIYPTSQQIRRFGAGAVANTRRYTLPTLGVG